MRACVLPLQIYYYYTRESSASNTEKGEDIFGMLRLFAEKDRQSETNEMIYLDHVIRFALSQRDLWRYIKFDAVNAKNATALLKKQITPLLKSRFYSIKEKIIFLVFILFPRLHWEYRILRDPSIRRWEKTEKKKRRKVSRETSGRSLRGI